MFSGDTAPSQNLVMLAKGADILVQEILSAWIDGVLPPLTRSRQAPRTHLLSAATAVEKVGKIAEFGVSTLVLLKPVAMFAR